MHDNVLYSFCYNRALERWRGGGGGGGGGGGAGYLIMFSYFSTKPYDETLHLNPSSKPSEQEGSDEGSQQMFLCKINKNYPLLSSNTTSYLELCTRCDVTPPE